MTLVWLLIQNSYAKPARSAIFTPLPTLSSVRWTARSGESVELLYRDIDAPIYRVTLEAAELLKLVNNAFHALKIGFANEIGRLCEPLGIDSHAIMQLVCADTKLNVSPAYLQPGFAFGGSCLPKDLRSISFHSPPIGGGASDLRSSAA